MSRHADGFTLLEIIVVLVIFGFLIAGLGQTIRFGLTAWRTEGNLSGHTSDIETVDRALRTIIQNLDPGDDTGRPAITGTEATMAGISRMPTPDTGLAEAPVEVGLAVSGNRLVLRWRPQVNADVLGRPAPPREATLLAHVARVAISYWRPTGRWVDSWRQPNLPALIRFHITLAGDHPPTWPDLVVAPLLSRP